SVVPNSQFAPLETAYRKYEANPTVENASAFLGEASKIYDMPGVTPYTFDPKATMGAAMDADFNARVRGMLDEAYATGKAGEFAQGKGVDSTLIDAEASAGLTMNMDEDGSGGYNGGEDQKVFENKKEQYTDTITWGILDVKVRPEGKGFFGERVTQNNPRVDAFELKINPNNESYYLEHPRGGYVQYENMVNDVVIDGKLVIQQKSFYYVNEMPEFAKTKVMQEAIRQVEAASRVGYTVEWLVSDQKAVSQLTDLFKSKNIKIVIRYFPE
ncbi:MAG: hypothetical protein AAGU75_25010, partial [Bacillota bacterium]